MIIQWIHQAIGGFIPSPNNTDQTKSLMLYTVAILEQFLEMIWIIFHAEFCPS